MGGMWNLKKGVESLEAIKKRIKMGIKDRTENPRKGMKKVRDEKTKSGIEICMFYAQSSQIA